MRDEIVSFFEKENIEYYAVLDYSYVREINTRLLERSGISPRSVILFLLPYYAGGADNLSIYASSLDYHIIIRDITSRLCGLLSSLYPNSRSIGYGDHSPIDERSAALIAGLGVLGDNGLVINEKYGSYVFVADVLTDIEPELLGASAASEIKKCIGCGACKRACPTGILRGESCDCLSMITQKKGELSDNEIALIKKYSTVWGCDECQRSCPYNKEPAKSPIVFFSEERIPHLTREIINSMSDEEFKRRAFAWRGKKTVLRNLEYYEKDEENK